jgi:hypothetical protein
MMPAFDDLWAQTRPAFAQERTWWRARSLALGARLGLGRRTVSGMLMATGQQFSDWSAAYRLFAQERFDSRSSWLRPAVLSWHSSVRAALVALMDDTLLRKRGRKIAGTSWRRDPLTAFLQPSSGPSASCRSPPPCPEGPDLRRARAILST